MDVYKDYAYTRYRRPKRIFPFVLCALIIAAGVLICNLFFGFIKFGPGLEQFSLPALKFWASVSEPYNSRTAAVAASRADAKSGLAGFVISEQWVVVNEISLTELDGGAEFSAQETDVALVRSEHKFLFESVFKSFSDNLEWLCGMTGEFLTQKQSAREIADAAVLRYNALQKLSSDLDTVLSNEQSVFYAEVLLALNKQAVTLYILSVEAASPGFLHELRLAACSVGFGYYDFVQNISRQAG